MTPVWFDLKRRKHIIREITNSWRDRRGETVRIHFHVTDEGALYELVYDLGDTSWTSGEDRGSLGALATKPLQF